MSFESQRTGDFEDIVVKYSDMVYKIAYAKVGNRSDADDIFQNVFLKYLNNKKPFINEEHRKAWLIKVTVNCSKSLFSSAWFKRTVPLTNEEPVYIEPESLELHNVVMKLPSKYRVVIHLFYYEDMSIKQISETLKIKPSTVRAQLTRARNLLKDKLKGANNFV